MKMKRSTAYALSALFGLAFWLFVLNAAFGATTPSTGLFFRANCTTITNPIVNETLCYQTTTTGGRNAGQLYTYNGSTYTQISGAGGAAPPDATYITQTANSTLTNEQNLAALSTGILKNATITGVVSIAGSGTDYAPATSGTSILKGNGSGGFSNTSAGTDYAAAPTGTANTPLFNNGSGGFTNGTRSGNTTAVATTTGSLTSGFCAQWDANGNIVQASGACGVAGTSYATIQDEGSNLPARPTMNFIGGQVTATDDAGNSRTNITVAATDANLSVSDVTTNDVSTTAHGFAPKAPNDATQFLNGVGAYSVPSGVSLIKSLSTTTITNIDTEQTLYTQSVDSLPATGSLRLTLAGTWLNNTGSNRNVAIAIKLGATTLWKDNSLLVGTGASTAPLHWNFVIQNLNATNSQRISGIINLMSTGAPLTGIGDFSTANSSLTSSSIVTIGGTSAEDLTSAKNLTITATLSFASASLTITNNFALLETF